MSEHHSDPDRETSPEVASNRVRLTEFPKDYRHLSISRWVENKIETFTRPTTSALDSQSRYYDSLVERFFPKHRDASILELGCGWGPLVYCLKRHGYRNIEAIDVIAQCCEFVGKELGVDAQNTDLLEFLDRRAKTYDVIAAFDVIEHFTKDEIVAITTVIHETLAPGGVFVFRVPNGASLGGLAIRYSGFTHEVAFTRQSVDELLRVAGFEKAVCVPEPVHARNPVHRALRRTARAFSGFVLSALTSFYLDRRFVTSNNVIGVGFKA
jgi:2-polyprenyl-3-methyl-5-hydroxy-6-metoxy-1,4-benzoquinol methylase